jgi:hypothetical protein
LKFLRIVNNFVIVNGIVVGYKAVAMEQVVPLGWIA